MEDLLAQTKGRSMVLIAFPDAGAILGIGDQGVEVCRYHSHYEALETFDDQLAVFLGSRGKTRMNSFPAG